MDLIFGVWDWVILAATMVLSIAIGLYYRFTGGRQKTNEEYLLGDRNMSVFPVAVSLMASFMSAITLLGVSAENYYYGMLFIVINISYGIATPIATNLYLPVFFGLQKTSTYEYLELRFGPNLRMLASLTYSLQMILYNGIVLYAPAIVLEAVTGLDRVVSILVVGLACTFYSTLGGMKAVIVTDLLQSFLMFAAVFVVVIFGVIQVGGFAEVFEIARQGGRLNFDSYSADPTVRHTWWSLVIGGMVTYLSLYAVNHTQVRASPQSVARRVARRWKSTKTAEPHITLPKNGSCASSERSEPYVLPTKEKNGEEENKKNRVSSELEARLQMKGQGSRGKVQRLLTVSTLQRSQYCLWISWPVLSVLSFITCLSGLVLYAVYKDCDPLAAGKINASDQLMPFFVVEAMTVYPGMVGLFVAGIFSASLSTISAACNALAAVTLSDYVSRWCKIRPTIVPWLTKLAACGYGFVFLALAFVAEYLGGVLQAALTIFGAVGGPLLGVFTLGMFTTSAREGGVSFALVSGLLMTLWISFGGPRPSTVKAPISVSGCDNNVTYTPPAYDDPNNYFYLYRISYMWTSTIGFLWVIIVGLLVSMLWRHQQPWERDGKQHPNPALFTPLLAKRLKRVHPQDKNSVQCELLTNGVQNTN